MSIVDGTLELTPGKLWGLRRLADPGGRFKMLAVDQRPPIKGPVAKARGADEAPYDDVAGVKAMLLETLGQDVSAALLDPHYAIPVGLDLLSPTKGLVVTLEDSLFQEGEGSGRLSAEIDDWSVAKIKRMGADAVKVLAWYRPDAADAVNEHQKDFVRRIGDACRVHDIPFVFELLVYPLPTDAEQTRDYVEMGSKRSEHVLASVETFADDAYGVDLFKLESPVAAKHADGSREVQDLFDEMGRSAGRPWVMLSAGAGKTEFRQVLEHAYAAGASGYLAGRAIWADAFAHFPEWDAMRDDLLLDARDYVRDLNAMTDGAAAPWHEHVAYGSQGARFAPRDASFRHGYPDFEGSA